MQKVNLTSMLILLSVGTLFAQVYTPTGMNVDANTYSAGNVAQLEAEAAAYI
jgi:hypothetical protein